jgi:FeS assembly SUF system regulator
VLRMRRITDQGFVVLAHFVRQDDGATLTARAVAEALGLPAATTAKVLKSLQRGGFLSSTRGLCGGYTLSCDPTRVTVVDVVEAFEGPLGLTECAVPGHITCDAHATCQLGPRWPAINAAVIDALANVTLADLAHGAHGATGLGELTGADAPAAATG